MRGENYGPICGVSLITFDFMEGFAYFKTIYLVTIAKQEVF
jgi:hypothetical protein